MPGNLLDSGTEPTSLAYPALADEFFTTVSPGKPTLFIGDLYIDLVAESCPTLYDPMGCSPPGSSVHVIFQGRILEWFVTSFSRGFPHPQIEPGAPEMQADSLPTESPGKSTDVYTIYIHSYVSML